MTPQEQLKHDLRPLKRRVWTVLTVVVVLELAFAAITHTIHIHGKETQRANATL